MPLHRSKALPLFLGALGCLACSRAPSPLDLTPPATLTQGGFSDGGTCLPTVHAAAPARVDVIFAMDTSGSMSEEIAQVKAGLERVMQRGLTRAGLDHRLVAVAARGAGTFQVCVDPPTGGPNCQDNPPLFRAVNQTVASTNALSLLLSTYDSANAALRWQGNLRQDALKVFILVTDDNSSLAGNSFDTQLLAKQPAGMFGTVAARQYVFHSIIGVTAGNPAVRCPSAVNIGAQYQVLSNLTGGLMLPVCEPDYTAHFQALVDHTRNAVACSMTLPAAVAEPQTTWELRYTPAGSGTGTILPQVADAASCAGDAFYVDNGRAVLCPSACTAVQGLPTAPDFDLLAGCGGV